MVTRHTLEISPDHLLPDPFIPFSTPHFFFFLSLLLYALPSFSISLSILYLAFLQILSSQLPFFSLEFALGQVRNCLAARYPRCLPERRKVEGARQPIGEAKEEHGRDPPPGILKGKAALGHLVLLGVAAAKVVHTARGVDFGLVRTRHIGRLSAGEDVEVVVGGVAAGVAFGADGGAYQKKKKKASVIFPFPASLSASRPLFLDLSEDSSKTWGSVQTYQRQ